MLSSQLSRELLLFCQVSFNRIFGSQVSFELRLVSQESLVSHESLVSFVSLVMLVSLVSQESLVMLVPARLLMSLADVLP